MGVNNVNSGGPSPVSGGHNVMIDGTDIRNCGNGTPGGNLEPLFRPPADPPCHP